MNRTRRKPARADIARGTAPSAAPRETPADAIPTPAAHRAALALWLGLALLLTARVALMFVPTMAWWGLNLQRFLSPAWAWAPWVVAALALLPPVGDALERPLRAAGDFCARQPALAMLIAAALAMTLVWSFADQVRYVGDFLIREGSVEEAIDTMRMSPQAMPLDTWLHYRFPYWLVEHAVTTANAYGRLLGALEAAALAALAIAVARELGLRGAALVATAATVFFVGNLALFTGYSKCFAEMAVLTIAVGLFAISLARDGRHMLALGVTLSIAFALHRTTPLYVLPWGVAWIAWLRRPGARERLRQPATLVALLLPVAAGLAAAPRMLHIFLTLDPRLHYAKPELAQEGGFWAASFAPIQLADSLNVLLLLAPLALLAPVLWLALGSSRPGGRVGAVLLALAAPWVISIPFSHVGNGMFRDTDVFAAPVAAATLLMAWLVGEMLRGDAVRPPVAAAIVLSAAMPVMQWLALNTDIERGLGRVEALMAEPPRRNDTKRVYTFDFLGVRWNQLERYENSAAALRRAVELAPSPTMLQKLALAEDLAGNPRGAIDAYQRLLVRDSTSVGGWYGLAAVLSRSRRFVESRDALEHVLRLKPGDPDATRMIAYVTEQDARQRAGLGQQIAPAAPATLKP